MDKIICGWSVTFLKLKNGIIMCCGRNEHGQLGLGDNLCRKNLVKIIPEKVSEIACGDFHTILRLMDGTLMSAGHNFFGQLGLGDEINRNVFTEITGIPKNISEVKCGSRYSIIKLTDGSLMSCGDNYYGQLGIGDKICRNKFTIIKDSIGNDLKI